MKHIKYKTSNTCSTLIEFDLTDDKKITNLHFMNGCAGNLLAISKLVEGKDALTVAQTLEGNHCGPRSTSCADQLSKAIYGALHD